MEFDRQSIKREQIESILLLDEDPVAKVQQIVDLGLEEEEANDIVGRYQIGQQTAVYYEQLLLGKFDNL